MYLKRQLNNHFVQCYCVMSSILMHSLDHYHCIFDPSSYFKETIKS